LPETRPVKSRLDSFATALEAITLRRRVRTHSQRVTELLRFACVYETSPIGPHQATPDASDQMLRRRPVRIASLKEINDD